MGCRHHIHRRALSRGFRASVDLALRWQLLYFVSAATLFTLASQTLSLDRFVIFYALHESVLYLVYLRVIMTVFRKV